MIVVMALVTHLQTMSCQIFLKIELIRGMLGQLFRSDQEGFKTGPMDFGK